MKITVHNSQVTLTKNNFLSSGGEGDIYVIGQTAYKIYQDPGKMIPVGKIQELSNISNQNVIRPQDICFNNKSPVGYSMRFISGAIPLVQTFTKAFRDRNNLDHTKMQNLVKELHSIVVSVHKADILIVDLNEMNFLVDQSFANVFAIDTDSYQTKSFPATAIMDSVRDRHHTTFSKETDWFSFAVVSFMMFSGIHPFKGKHPTVKSMDDRMKQNISVFNKDVGVPHACYPFDIIPEAYRHWYKAVFEDNKRLAPPDDFSGVVAIVQTVRNITCTDNINIEELFSLEGDILNVFFNSTYRILTTSNFYHKAGSSIKVSKGVVVFSTDVSSAPILAKINNGKLELYDPIKLAVIPCDIAVDQIMSYQNMNGYVSLYVKNGGQICRVEVLEGKTTLVLFDQVANVVDLATKIFDGVIIQDLLGSYFVSVFPFPKTHSQINIKELSRFKILDAKYDSGVLIVLGADKKTGSYSRLTFRFSKDHLSYDVRIADNISLHAISFVTLDSGVVVTINEDEKIELFSSNKDVTGIKTVDDNMIGSDMRLYKNGDRKSVV
jgi:serine/threonine protein kinase